MGARSILTLLSLVVAAPAGQQTVAGAVVDTSGRPLQNVVVFAADAGSDAVAAVAVSDEAGKVALAVPPRRHNFGVLSSTLGVVRLNTPGPLRFELVVAPLPPVVTGATPDAPAARINAPRAYIVRGRVVDESGAGLEGVRLEAYRETGIVVATSFSSADGGFAIVVPGGKSQLRASAPGLFTARSVQQSKRLLLVMAIAADLQRLTFTSGRVLSFRPSDSIDPEYTPPAPVRTWLQFTYGICPASAPLKASEKRALKKYWYLDVLRREPPNPASISTINCTPPTSYQPPAGPPTNIGGFDIWPDAIGGQRY